MPDETRTVEESAFNDVMYEQYEQARARMEGMTRRELRALQGLCHELIDLVGEVLDEKAVSGDHAPDSAAGLSVGALREAIIDATELQAAFGVNLHESKEVLVRVDGQVYPLRRVSVGFVEGRFAMVLDA